MTTGKTIDSTRQTFVNKAMSLLFNMLSRLVITFLSRSKCLLISWLQTPSFPLQLKKNHEINLSTLDEVHFCCSASRAILSSLSKLKRRLDSLYATQEVPRDTLCSSRGTPSFPPQREKSPVFPTSSPDEGWFPCFNSRGIPTFPSHFKRRPVSPIATWVELRGSCHKLKGHWVHP